MTCFVTFNYNWQFVASHTFARQCPFSENSRTHRYPFDLRSMSVSHRGKPLVSFVSASSLSSNSVRFHPNRDKGVSSIGASDGSVALRNLIVERRRESELTRPLFFPAASSSRGRVPQKPHSPSFIIFPRRPHRTPHRRRFPYSLSPLKEISRLFQFPLILLADRRAPGMILYFIPRVS